MPILSVCRLSRNFPEGAVGMIILLSSSCGAFSALWLFERGLLGFPSHCESLGVC